MFYIHPIMSYNVSKHLVIARYRMIHWKYIRIYQIMILNAKCLFYPGTSRTIYHHKDPLYYLNPVIDIFCMGIKHLLSIWSSLLGSCSTFCSTLLIRNERYYFIEAWKIAAFEHVRNFIHLRKASFLRNVLLHLSLRPFHSL